MSGEPEDLTEGGRDGMDGWREGGRGVGDRCRFAGMYMVEGWMKGVAREGGREGGVYE